MMIPAINPNLENNGDEMTNGSQEAENLLTNRILSHEVSYVPYVPESEQLLIVSEAEIYRAENAYDWTKVSDL